MIKLEFIDGGWSIAPVNGRDDLDFSEFEGITSQFIAIITGYAEPVTFPEFQP